MSDKRDRSPAEEAAERAEEAAKRAEEAAKRIEKRERPADQFDIDKGGSGGKGGSTD